MHTLFFSAFQLVMVSGCLWCVLTFYDCAAPSTVGSAPANPASSVPKATVLAEPAFNKEAPQQGQQQPKKEKKAPKASAGASVPATSGDGLFYRAQLQVSSHCQATTQQHGYPHHIRDNTRFICAPIRPPPMP